MGGFGSGWNQMWRDEKRPLVEDCLRLDIFELEKADFFRRGRRATVHLDWGGRSGFLGCEDPYDYTAEVIFEGMESKAGNSGIVTILPSWVAKETIARVWKSPRWFGGAQWFFNCPIGVDAPCNRSVRFLYVRVAHGVFGCRWCNRLVYRSSQQTRTWAAGGVLGWAEKAMESIKGKKGANDGRLAVA